MQIASCSWLLDRFSLIFLRLGFLLPRNLLIYQFFNVIISCVLFFIGQRRHMIFIYFWQPIKVSRILFMNHAVWFLERCTCIVEGSRRRLFERGTSKNVGSWPQCLGLLELVFEYRWSCLDHAVAMYFSGYPSSFFRSQFWRRCWIELRASVRHSYLNRI